MAPSKRNVSPDSQSISFILSSVNVFVFTQCEKFALTNHSIGRPRVREIKQSPLN